MYPHERSLVEEMQEKPFVLIGVNSDPLERARKAVAENGLNWRSFQNQPEGAEKQISDDWKVSGWPTIVVLDADFRIRYRGHSGDEATAVAKELVAALTKQAAGE
ncbi:MAG: hypothetical protein D6702_01245 [Planctomycetota bacterium]|nr:MAG: hypothetical protein D6702_01245 [Planctomycetota bacterium]